MNTPHIIRNHGDTARLSISTTEFVYSSKHMRVAQEQQLIHETPEFERTVFDYTQYLHMTPEKYFQLSLLYEHIDERGLIAELYELWTQNRHILTTDFIKNNFVL